MTATSSLMVQQVKNPPAMQETWVRSPGQDDPLEKEMATHSRYSCLENPMDRRALRATVHRVAQSQDTTEHEHKDDYYVDLIDKGSQVEKYKVSDLRAEESLSKQVYR